MDYKTLIQEAQIRGIADLVVDVALVVEGMSYANLGRQLRDVANKLYEDC